MKGGDGNSLPGAGLRVYISVEGAILCQIENNPPPLLLLLISLIAICRDKKLAKKDFTETEQQSST